ESSAKVGFVAVLRDLRVYVFAFAVFTQFCVANVFAFWGPTLLRSSGMTNVWHLGLLNAIPFIVSAAAMVAMGWHSDLKMERGWHAGCGQMLTVLGLCLFPSVGGNPLLTVGCLAMMASGHYIFWSIFWTIPPTYFRRGSAPAGIALISSIGATG